MLQHKFIKSLNKKYNVFLRKKLKLILVIQKLSLF